jgi:hypothetical protein
MDPSKLTLAQAQPLIDAGEPIKFIDLRSSNAWDARRRAHALLKDGSRPL